MRKRSSCDCVRAGEAGFGLIELVVAVSLLAIVMMGLALSMGSAFTLARNNRNRTIAANLASREMDVVRSADFVDLVAGLLVSTQVLDGITYTVNRESELVSQSSTTGPCDSVSGTPPAFLRVSVAVSWPNMKGTRPVTTQTVLTPPVGAYDPSSGNLAVKVLDRQGLPASGHSTSIAGPATRTQVTTSDGCAFFGYVPAGTYTVKVDDVGYVDRQGVTAPSQSVPLAVAATKSLQFDYDRAATATFNVAGGGGGLVPATLPVSVANPSLLPAGFRVFTGATYPRTVPSLFPYADGYEYYLGICNDADPEGLDVSGVPYYTGSARPAALVTGPGDIVAATIDRPSFDVRVLNGIGTPRVGATVTLLHAIGPGCPAATSYVAGVTDAAGMLRIVVPYGTWTFKAAAGALNATSAAKVFTPAGPNPTAVDVVVP